MPSESELDALEPYVGTVRDLILWEDMDPSWARQFLIGEHEIDVEDDTWEAFLQQRVLRHEAGSLLQRAADALSKTPPAVLHTQLLIALAEAYAREDVRAQRIQRADTRQAVRPLAVEAARWRWAALALAAFTGGLGGMVVGWLLRG